MTAGRVINLIKSKLLNQPEPDEKNLLKSIDLVSNNLKEINEAESYGDRINITSNSALAALVDKVNVLLEKIEQKEQQILQLKETISQREEQNALLWLEIEHNLCVAKEEAETDPLTGLFNRKSLDRKIDSEIRQAQLDGNPLSLLIADLDHFKKINDTYGHQVGDEVLKCFAGLLKSLIRVNDIAARYGGEEFIIILPSTPVENAIQVAERINQKLPDFVASELRHIDGMRCTVSIGVADYPICGQEKDKLIAAADCALYEAKNKGRNLVVYYSDISNLDATPQIA